MKLDRAKKLDLNPDDIDACIILGEVCGIYLDFTSFLRIRFLVRRQNLICDKEVFTCNAISSYRPGGIGLLRGFFKMPARLSALHSGAFKILLISKVALLVAEIPNYPKAQIEPSSYWQLSTLTLRAMLAIRLA
jgi:hypothetical protein